MQPWPVTLVTLKVTHQEVLRRLLQGGYDVDTVQWEGTFSTSSTDLPIGPVLLLGLALVTHILHQDHQIPLLDVELTV